MTSLMTYGAEGILSMFKDDTKPRGVTDATEEPLQAVKMGRGTF